MSHEHLNQELLTWAKIIYEHSWMAFGFLAFTVRQREWIRERDNETCQHPECRNRKNKRLEVHHIIPQRYAKEIGIDPDYETNGLTLCKDCHSRVHPDRLKALRTYRQDKVAFQRMEVDRDTLLKQKKIYWRETWDRVFTTTAVRNSQRFRQRHPDKQWPEKPEKS